MKCPQQYPSAVRVLTPSGERIILWAQLCKELSLSGARRALREWEKATAKHPLLGGEVLLPVTQGDYWVIKEIEYKDSLANPKSRKQKAAEATWGALRKALSYKLF